MWQICLARAAAAFFGALVLVGCTSPATEGSRLATVGLDGGGPMTVADGPAVADAAMVLDGPAFGCNATSCPDGCCDHHGECRDGDTNGSCGTGGAQCANCLGQNQFCMDQQCVVCDGLSCPNGCCNATGCQPGNQSGVSCGTGGEACRDCLCDNQQCVACDATSCPNGCCRSDYHCEPGTDNTRCGTGGAACANCTWEGQGCVAQTCTDCNADTCPNGCCEQTNWGPVCKTGTALDACGIGGAKCQDCGANGQVCSTQKCMACNAASCPNGCCTAAGVCLAGTATNACGTGGILCQPCSLIGQMCAGQQCQACQPGTCPDGCCDATGQCRPGTATEACGTGGVGCWNCSATAQACSVDQQCAACDATTCPDGCCDVDGSCQPGGFDFACGHSGGGCVNCELQLMTCGRPPQWVVPQCVSNVCNAATCPNGCCDATGACQQGMSETQCGTGGVACTDCRDWNFGGVCLNQQCVECNATSCPDGCCTSHNLCRPGTDDRLCGKNAQVCVDCYYDGPNLTYEKICGAEKECVYPPWIL